MMSESRPKSYLPDVNVLVALTNPAHQHHRQAHTWLADISSFATTPITENGLIRLLLNPSVTGQQVSANQALAILCALRADPRAAFLADASSLADAEIDMAGLVGYRQVTDWHLVNLAARHDTVLATFDRKISQGLTSIDRRHVLTL